MLKLKVLSEGVQEEKHKRGQRKSKNEHKAQGHLGMTDVFFMAGHYKGCLLMPIG